MPASGLQVLQSWRAFWASDPATGEFNIRNVCHISLSTFFMCTAFIGIENFSTTFIGGKLGSTAPAVMYIVYTLMSLLAPCIVRTLGIKGSLIFNSVCICYVAVAYLLASISGNQPLRWCLVISSAVLFGISAAPMWVAQGQYMTANGKALSVKWVEGYTKEDGGSGIPMLGTLNGMFWFAFQLTQVSSGLIASTLSGDSSSVTGHGNSAILVYVAYVACAVLGLVCTVFLRTTVDCDSESDQNCDPAAAANNLNGFADSSSSTDSRRSSSMCGSSSLVSVARACWEVVCLWMDPRLLLMLPMFMYSGLEMGWLMADFTDQVVTITLGRQNVGFVIVAFGACDAVFSLLCGKLSDRAGRLTVLVVGCLAQALAGGCIVYGKVDEGSGAAAAVGNMCSVVPGGNQWDLALGIAVLWALGDAAIRTQVDTIVSETFSTTTTTTTTTTTITTSTSASASSISSPSIDKGNTTNNTASADAAAVSDAGRTTDSLGAALSNYRMAQSLVIAVSFLFPVMGLSLWRTTSVLVVLCITGVVCVALKAQLYQQAHDGSGEERMTESTNYANSNATVHNAVAKGSCCVDAKCEEKGATPNDLENQVLERA